VQKLRWRSLRRIVPVALLLLGSVAARGGDDPLGNWFNDPFLQVRSGERDCPTPFGPLMRRSQMVNEEHSRVERGTSCWLAKKCAQANAYFDDAHIGEQLARHFAEATEFADTTLWLTVKRKFVWVEGCSPVDVDAAIDRFVRATPGVDMVFVDVRHGALGHVPYKIATPAETGAPRATD
jgi:hypothetical protein